jgi:hypothetical protein
MFIRAVHVYLKEIHKNHTILFLSSHKALQNVNANNSNNNNNNKKKKKKKKKKNS